MADEKKRTDFAEWDPTARIELPPLFLPPKIGRPKGNKMRQAVFIVILAFVAPLVGAAIIVAFSKFLGR